MQRVSHARFYNLYGPTEATIASSCYRVPVCPTNDAEEIPIGEPCNGESLLVLDDKLQPVGTGEIGDLYIGGVGLSPGYWRDSAKTEEMFLTTCTGRIYKTGDLARAAEDGSIYLLGRADTQIKSRGYRIELGEIERALHAEPGIADAAVVALESKGFEGILICCAYVADPTADLTPGNLKQRLSQQIPSYMLPARWLPMERLPLNANGKTDRNRLKEEFRDQVMGRSGVPQKQTHAVL